MAYYEELNRMLKSVVETNVVGNPNLRKLVYYYPTDVDFRYSPFVNESGIPRADISPSDVYMKYIFPMPKDPDIETEQKCFITCCLTGGDYINGGKWREIYFVFDVICNLDAWITKEGYRVFSIAEEIDKTFNYQDPNSANNSTDSRPYYYLLDMPIVNKPIASPFRIMSYSYKYYGLQLRYCITVNSNMGCT